ncbi:conserved hypothetical protein [Vibrio chagasii]|nr:conserved hypothetical protein [Vibrio chagasii]
MTNVEMWTELQKLREDRLNGISYCNSQQKYVLFLASRITELCLDVAVLLESGRIASAPIIIRTALESYADLASCIKDATYPEKITKSLYWQLFEISKGTDSKKVEYYKTKGKYLPVNKRFNAAGLGEIFNGYYKVLSLHSHGNLSSLIEFHSEDSAVILGTVSDDQRVVVYFEHVVNLYALVLKDTFTYFGLDQDSIKKVESVLEQLNSKSVQ